MGAVVALALGRVALAGTTPDAQTMVYRGQLQQNGVPFNGLVSMSFDFFDAQGNCLEGSSVCAAPAIPVYVLNGEFSVDLVLPPGVLQSQSPTIQVTVNGTPLQGSQRIYPVPFAERGRTQGPFVAEEEVDVVSTDAGVTDVAIGASGSGANGRKIAFAQQAGDDSAAGTIAYYPDYGAGTQSYLDLVGAGTGPNRQVHVADNLSVTHNVTVGANLSVAGNSSVNGAAAMGSANVTGSAVVGGYVYMGYQFTYGYGDGSNTDRAAVCPSGEVVIGGGCRCNPNNVLASFPPLNNEWECDCTGVPANGQTVAWAICARIQ